MDFMARPLLHRIVDPLADGLDASISIAKQTKRRADIVETPKGIGEWTM
jgi:hypothetical protein